MPFLQGKTIVLTGGTTGLGLGLLRGCYEAGVARVFLVARSEQKARLAAEAAPAGCEVEVVLAQLSSMASVCAAAKRIADSIAATNGEIHAMLLNAAALAPAAGPEGRTMTEEGLEQTFAVNHAATFLLVRLLAPRLAARARVLITGSDAAQVAVRRKLNRSSLQGEQGVGMGGFTQYGHSKLMNEMV